MKIAVIKLGARITWDTDGAVAPGEAVSICKALTLGGAEVHVFTKLLKKDTLDPSLVWHDILEADQGDLDTLDTLVVINGNVNFFGGAEDRAQILNYEIINNFQGRVVYIICDPELPLMQIWENVSKKPWGVQYAEKNVNITRTDIEVLSQPFDLEAVKAGWPKKGVPIAKFFHFPMERFPYLNGAVAPTNSPTVDLMYGGTPRGGRRIPNLYKWYWNLPADIHAEIFGSIDADDFYKHPKIGKQAFSDSVKSDYPHLPTFTGKVKYDQVLPKMSTALAHLATGDPSYEVLDLIPQRIAECHAAGNIVFVDANMDKSRRIYPVGTLAHDFLYVSTQAELVERLRIVKDDPSIRADMLEAQRIATNFDAELFCKSLVSILKS
jgi:hypothetical protein